MFWHSLPVEIQTHILEALVLHEDSARYASVCRAWQTIIEPKNIARLKVTQSRLARFSDIGYRHRHLVKYIWFSIEPSDYRCPHCGGAAILNWYPTSPQTIRKAIQDLIIQLSAWKPSGSLLLDISVQAPSGLRHSSSTIQYGPGFLSEPKKAKSIRCSHWLHGTLEREIAGYFLNRITGITKPEPELRQNMPKARAVTSLHLGRQTRRQWKSETLEELVDLLPEVREIHYEPWRDWDRMEERPTNTSKSREKKVTVDINFY